MERCGKCGLKIRGAGTTTPTGQRLCAACGDAFVGAAIGVMEGDLGTAIALGHAAEPGRATGVLAWIRRAMGRGPA
jgi:hypothetical protein